MLHPNSDVKKPTEQKKFCHCKPTCGVLLFKQARKIHYAQIADPSTIEASESEGDADSEDDSLSSMEIDPDHHSSNHRTSDEPRSLHTHVEDYAHEGLDNLPSPDTSMTVDNDSAGGDAL
ncbi:hypothetical protein K438DRAFT_1968845 [Mycena galopus ATCC 62051]|nr:hypothetical protein K438DRAFT_1968845 [Mycena galopus ATCC 62051]